MPQSGRHVAKHCVVGPLSPSIFAPRPCRWQQARARHGQAPAPRCQRFVQILVQASGSGAGTGHFVSVSSGRPRQAGAAYGVKRQQGDGSFVWELIAGATLVEAAYLAWERQPSSRQVQASLSRPLRVQRAGSQTPRWARLEALRGPRPFSPRPCHAFATCALCRPSATGLVRTHALGSLGTLHHACVSMVGQAAWSGNPAFLCCTRRRPAHSFSPATRLHLQSSRMHRPSGSGGRCAEGREGCLLLLLVASPSASSKVYTSAPRLAPCAS